MQALVYEGPRILRMRDIAEPELQDDEVLIEVHFSGICGSELSGYLGHNSLRQPPLVFGHEFSGKVAALGAAVSKPGIAVGTAVTANPLVTCGTCRYCLRGMQQLCSSRKLLSASLPGSNAKYVKIPDRFVYPLPAGVTLAQGALAEPIACAVRAADLAQPSPQSVAFVAGMGPIGLFVLQALKAYNVRQIIVSDTNAERLEYARQQGAIAVNPKETDVRTIIDGLTDGRGADIAVDCVGNHGARSACVGSVSAGGTVVFVGLHEAETVLPINTMIRNEIRCVGSFAYGAVHFETAIQWLADGKAGLSGGIVKAPLTEGAEWFERLVQNPGDVTKVLLTPG